MIYNLEDMEDVASDLQKVDEGGLSKVASLVRKQLVLLYPRIVPRKPLAGCSRTTSLTSSRIKSARRSDETNQTVRTSCSDDWNKRGMSPPKSSGWSQ